MLVPKLSVAPGNALKYLRSFCFAVFSLSQPGSRSFSAYSEKVTVPVLVAELDEMNEERNALAARYTAEIKNPLLRLPETRPGAYNIWHQYVVRCPRRDELQAFLLSRDIHTIIHYPIPPHLSEAYAYLGLSRGALPQTEALGDTVLSLPMYNGMTVEEQSYVIDALNAFR